MPFPHPQDMWIGVMHHVTGEHEWVLGACNHGPLIESREKDWILKDSIAHQRLYDIITDPRWLKSIPKYLTFRYISLGFPNENILL